MTLEALGERLRGERARLGISQRKLAEMLDVSRNSQVAYESGHTSPTADYLMRANRVGIDSIYVMTGSRSDGAVRETTPASQGHDLILPEIDISYSMGGGIVIADHVDANMVTFPADWLRGLVKGSVDQLFVARGEGDSMQPTLLDGDIVIVDTAQNSLRSQDRLWCISYGDLGMIKRLRVQPDGGVQVLSDNTNISPFVAYDGELHIVGRVIWVGRKA